MTDKPKQVNPVEIGLEVFQKGDTVTFKIALFMKLEAVDALVAGLNAAADALRSGGNRIIKPDQRM